MRAAIEAAGLPWSVRKWHPPGPYAPMWLAYDEAREWEAGHYDDLWHVEYTPAGAAGMSWDGTDEDLMVAIRKSVKSATAGAKQIAKAVEKSAKQAQEFLK